MKTDALKGILKQVAVTVAVAVATPLALEHTEAGIQLARKGVQKAREKIAAWKGKK